MGAFSPNRFTFILLAVVFVYAQSHAGLALRIDISPSIFNTMIPTVVNISCLPDPSLGQDAIEILVMELLGNDGKPIATLRQNTGISNNNLPNDTDFHFTGRIDDVFSDSYLKLTMMHPRAKDTGLYECVMYYINRNTGVLSEKRAEANLTSGEDTKTVLEYLVSKVSDLEKRMEAREKHEVGLRTNISTLEDKLEKEITKENYVSAFSAKYSKKGLQRAGDTLVFNEAIVNIGPEGYNTTNGLFRTPLSGVYSFHLVASTVYAGGYINLELRVNDKAVIGLELGDKNYDDQSTASIVVALRTDDVVKVVVRNNVGAAVDARDYTTFSGYLIRQINI